MHTESVGFLGARRYIWCRFGRTAKAELELHVLPRVFSHYTVPDATCNLSLDVTIDLTGFISHRFCDIVPVEVNDWRNQVTQKL
jgi:hypothetical protein